jgi:hypothetical protein
MNGIFDHRAVRWFQVPYEVFLLVLTVWLLPWVDLLFNPSYWKVVARTFGG